MVSPASRTSLISHSIQCPPSFSHHLNACVFTSMVSTSKQASIKLPNGAKSRATLPGLLLRAAALPAAEVGNIATQDMDKLALRKEGYNYWEWRGHKIHYIVEGTGKPIVLIHGFGASSYHWRYNIPVLSRYYKVYAMDLIGFGWSEKPLIEYGPLLWRDQVADFIENIVEEPVILAGNSIGGFTVLTTAAMYPKLVSGLILLNASGRFAGQDATAKNEARSETIWESKLLNPLKEWGRRWLIYFTFWQARQPSRIRSVLMSVYKDQTNVDDSLVESIVLPTQDPNAREVYYRMMSQFISQPPPSDLNLNKLLADLSCPLMLLWGDLDPWMGSTKADMIKQLYPNTTIVRLNAGHCPHDESPEQANKAILEWIASLD